MKDIYVVAFTMWLVHRIGHYTLAVSVWVGWYSFYLVCALLVLPFSKRCMPPDTTTWKPWFAWHPVYVKGHGHVWLRTLYRRTIMFRVFNGYGSTAGSYSEFRVVYKLATCKFRGTAYRTRWPLGIPKFQGGQDARRRDGTYIYL